MTHAYPVGKTQRMVLNALGLTATDFSDAERIFDDLGLVVASKRQGRSVVPVIRRKATRISWNSDGEGEAYQQPVTADLSKISQWMED